MRFRAILLQRCPACFKGRIFAGILRMNQTCPECGVRFMRESGFFVGAMYFSYALAIAAGVPTYLLMWLAEVPEIWIIATVAGEILLLAPFLFRFSRVIWLHIDRTIDPG